MLAAILSRKATIIRVFWFAYFAWFGIVIFTAIIPNGDVYWIQLGQFSGNTAVVFFALAMLPGILRRFRVSQGPLQQLRLILMAFRRQLGLATFAFAVCHQLWVKLLPALRFELSLLPTMLFEVFGTISLMLLVPLALTSNNFSVKKLGKNWHRLHWLVYIIAWTIFFHVALIKGVSPITGLILAIAILELTSWIYYWFSQPKPAPPVSSQT